MEAFEFEAIHKDGMIKIPNELRKNLTKKLEVWDVHKFIS